MKRGTSKRYEYHRKHYLENIDKIKAYRDAHKKERRLYDIKRRAEKKEEIALLKKEYHEKNKDKENNRTKKWRAENREYMRKYFLERWKKFGKILIQQKLEKRRKNPHLLIRHSISSSIQQRLKKRMSNKGYRSTFNFLPYTIEELMSHLESQFKPRMAWKNYGKWHIDHIIPDCRFNYTSVDDEEFKKCWALENLQPLWAKDNLVKNKR